MSDKKLSAVFDLLESSDSDDDSVLKPIFGSSSRNNNKVKQEVDKKPIITTEQTFLHQKIAKEFPDGVVYFGTVKSYTPASRTEEGEDDLWFIVYDDEDSEDMNFQQLQEHVELYQKSQHMENKKPPSRRVTASPNFNLKLDDHEESDDEEESGSSSRKKRPRITYKDSDDEEELSSEEESSFCDAHPLKKKYATLEQQAWLGGGNLNYESESEDSDGEEELLEVEEGFHVSELADAPTSRSRRRDSELLGAPPPPPPVLTAQDVNNMLQEIEKREDLALQKLLLDSGFRFQLLPHQFLAVRKIAGVPETFPLHAGSYVHTPRLANIAQALHGLDSDENKCQTKGVLIADEMGLGKTVEAIAGAILRNAISAAKGNKKKPSLIISPNHAVLIQWRDTLIKNGVPIERIHMFEAGQHSKDAFEDQASFILLTRYTLQSEVKRVFRNLDEQPNAAISVLFRHVTTDNLKRLKLQYLDENGKDRVENPYRRKGESASDCVTRNIHLCTRRMRERNAEPVFETLIVDEAHFLKNLSTFWAIGAALCATHALRCAPLTGTPYNNGPNDLAAMMTFVDAAKHSSYKDWWSNATSDYASSSIRKKVTTWHDTYLVRRRKADVLKDLVPKIVQSQIVSQYPAEQSVYDHYEGTLQKILKQFSELVTHEHDNPIVREQLKELFTILMALMSNMRSANIHAMLPGGREYTKQFSPTRQHLRAMEQRPKTCVCCDQNMRPSIPVVTSSSSNNNNDDGVDGGNRAKHRRPSTNIDELEEGEENNDDAEEMIGEEEEELQPLPCSLCDARNGQVSHFAHAECIDHLKAVGESCPRCKHAKNTMNCELPDEGTKKYCQHILGGFVGSSKINAVVDWYHQVPEDDKVLILSFFKGGLDLLEGIFVHDFGIDCARFDGDLDRRTSLVELERFKADPNCKILLATVQSGGVGLNIVEANHVAFLDRWYNPFVHQQAEDRCHRIGQTKDVDVVYFDCAATIDEAMIQMNLRKKENSAILLADGFEIGNHQSLSYKDLSGLLCNLLSTIRSHRTGWIEASPENENKPIPPVPDDVMTSALEGRIARNLGSTRGPSAGDAGETKGDVYSGVNGTEDLVIDDWEEEDAEAVDNESADGSDHDDG